MSTLCSQKLNFLTSNYNKCEVYIHIFAVKWYTVYMIDLTAAGLSSSESICYTTLLEKAYWKPAEFAQTVKESRTNSYKILDKLVNIGLAERFDKAKKLHYRATNPTNLLQLARAQRFKREKAEQELEQSAEQLFKTYFEQQEQPGVQYFQGKVELLNIYHDQIKMKQPIYIIRPDYNMDIYDFDFMTKIRHMARKAGIPRYAITPDRKMAPKNYIESDQFMLLTRTWLPASAYTAPVEWDVYGDKVAIMSFGQEATGVIIQSPQIAEAFRQLYKIMETGIRQSPGYENLPKEAAYSGATSE
jgi:predicted transcriptional regulator